MSILKVISILAIVFGVGLVPAGYAGNILIRNTVSEGVPEALVGLREAIVPEMNEKVKAWAIPEVLQGVKEEMVPEIARQINDLAIPEVMKGILEEAQPWVEDYVETLAIPQVLEGIRTEGHPMIELLINSTVLATLTNLSIMEWVYPNNGGDANPLAMNKSLNYWFNAPSALALFFYDGNLVITWGFSYFHASWYPIGPGHNLTFTPKAQHRIMLDGVNETVNGEHFEIVGLMNDTEQGSGFSGFISLYERALTNQSINYTMQYLYKANWTQLTAIYNWSQFLIYKLYVPAQIFLNPPIFDSIVRIAVNMTYGMTVDELAYLLFYQQWANGTLWSGGMDFSTILPGLEESLIGFEAASFNETGDPISTNISLTVAMDLWDTTNSSSFLNLTYDENGFPDPQETDGLQKWLSANNTNTIEGVWARENLTQIFGLTDLQMDILLDWLWNGNESFKLKMVPPLFEYDQDIPIPIYATQLFYDQWANGTLFTDGVDLGELIGMDEPVLGLEVSLPPYSSNMTFATVSALLNETNSMSFVNMTYREDGFPDEQPTDGIQKWLNASSENEAVANAAKNDLKTQFGLDNTQLNMILDWLFNGSDSFKNHLVPLLFEYENGYTIADYAEDLFYDQWANGALYPDGIDLGAALNVSESVLYWEIGVPKASGLSVSTARKLLKANDPLAIGNYSDGIQKWLEANSTTEEGNATREELIEVFGLTEKQMDNLLEYLWGYKWSFKEDIVPTMFRLVQGQTTLEYAELLFYDQWANGSLYPEGIELPIGDGLKGWEVGVPKPTAMSLKVAEGLFYNETSLSLCNPRGLQKWYEAIDPYSASYHELRGYWGFTYTQMDIITKWLQNLRDNVVPFLAQDTMDLPTDPLTLGKIIALGLVLPGYSIATVGVVELSVIMKKSGTIIALKGKRTLKKAQKLINRK